VNQLSANILTLIACHTWPKRREKPQAEHTAIVAALRERD